MRGSSPKLRQLKVADPGLQARSPRCQVSTLFPPGMVDWLLPSHTEPRAETSKQESSTGQGK